MKDLNVASTGTLQGVAQAGANQNTSAKKLADQAGVPVQQELFEHQDPATTNPTPDPRQMLGSNVAADEPAPTSSQQTGDPKQATGTAPSATTGTPAADDDDFELPPDLMAAMQGKGDAENDLVSGLNAANQGPVRNAAGTGQQQTTANGNGGGGGVKTPWPPNQAGGGNPQNPGNVGSQLGAGQYGTAGNTFTDVATRQKAIQDDLNQAQTIYMQMAADRYKWLSTMQRIWMDMRTSVLENILGATKNMIQQMEKIQDGFIQLLES